jgi:NodT family efflux transporter outer membrane factor (OMF) lipoprotein
MRSQAKSYVAIKAGNKSRRYRTVAPLTCVAYGILILVLAGCTVGPKYARPSVQTPAAYKEIASSDVKRSEQWKAAQPSDTAARGKWWEIFHDPRLNALEVKADASNQEIAAAAASYFAARAVIREARSQYFPTVAANPSIMNARPSPAQFGGLRTGTSGSSGVTIASYNDFSVPAEASWEPDLWGRVRNAVRGATYTAQASAADLENARLSAEAELAVDYYQLRAQDALKRLFDSTVAAYQEALNLTQVQFKAGVGTDEAVAQAEAQLEATQAQDTNLGILRAQYEHAIALLVGEPASTFSISAEPFDANWPAIPAGVPSELLERRPDIAASERAMAQANAQIGVAKAAYYPNITLSATGGFGNSSISDWFTWPSRFWSVGPSLAETIFDGGLRNAAVQQYRFNYDQTVANYRQTVLTAFQQVEDNLAAVRILSQDIQQQDAAIQSAQRSLHEATVRFQAGLDPYLNVITAQTIFLSDQQTAVNFRMQQMVASVQLVKALGGGWDIAQLPSPQQLRSNVSGNASNQLQVNR